MATSGNKSVAVTSWDTLKFSWWQSGDQSIAKNQTTIGWKLELIATSSGRISSTTSKPWNVTVNGKKYSGNTTVGIANNATKTLASGYTDIAHNSNGTKTFSYSFSQSFSGITFSGKALGTVSGSGSGTLNTIPRKSLLAVGNGRLGSPQTLVITKADSSFKHKISFKCGDTTGWIAGNSTTFTTETSILWTAPEQLAKHNTTGTSLSVVITLYTFTSGGTQTGSDTRTVTYTIPETDEFKPKCSVTVSDSKGYADKYGAYIKGHSRFKVVVTPTLAYNSAIASYSTAANGSKYTTASFTTDVLKSSGSLTVSATVKDKRGRSSTAATVTKSVLNYAAPEINIKSVERRDYDGNGENYIKAGYIAVTFSFKTTALNNKNTAAYSIQYKKTTDENYTTENLAVYANQYSVSNKVFVFPAAQSSTYDIVLTAKDDFTETKKATVGKSTFKLWSIFRKYLGIAFGKYAELEGVFDIGFKTRFFGGILHPVLEANTYLNDVQTPNTYVGANVSTHNYGNCPISSGTFTLEVVGCGEEGQVKQRLTECKKTDARTYERFYYQGTWGDWVCVSDFAGKLLWSGAYYMNGDQTINLAEPVSKQRSGIVLVFSRYSSGAAQDYHFNIYFVPKYQIKNHTSHGISFLMTSDGSFGVFAAKYLYIANTHISGNENNEKTGTGACGITYTNNGFVLRYVIGV